MNRRAQTAAPGLTLALCARGDPKLPSGTDFAGMDRSVAPGANFDDWYAAFDIPAGQPLYLAPADRVRVW